MDTLTVLQARIRENAAKYFPHLAGQDVIVRFTRLPAGSEVLYRYELRSATSASPPMEIIAKLGREPLFIEFDHLNSLHENRSANTRAILAPRPLDFFPDINALLTEKIGGQPFLPLLLRRLHFFARRAKRESIGRWMRLCGQWLANYHRLTREPDAMPFGYEWLETAIEKIGELESFGFPQPVGTTTRKMLLRLHEYGTHHLAPYAHRHGTFSPNNVHVANDWVCVFDLNYGGSECVYEDLSYFLVTLETMNKWPRHPFFDRRTALTMKTHYLNGYFESGQDCCRALLEGHTLKELLFRCTRQRGNVAKRARWLLPLFDAFQVKGFYPRSVLRQCKLLADLLDKM